MSSCMDTSIARCHLLHFWCWFPVSLKNSGRFGVFGFSFGFISHRLHGESAHHGHCFHFLSHFETVTSHLKSTKNVNCMCQVVNAVMANRGSVWQKSQSFMTSLMAKMSICSHLDYKRTLIQLSLLATNFILCKPCSMSPSLLLPAPSCTECLLCREITCVGTSAPCAIMSHFSLFRLFAFLLQQA